MAALGQMNSALREQFLTRGWLHFAADAALQEWVEAVRPVALATAERADLRDTWMRCGGTWFVGANVLSNDTDGAVPAAAVPPLRGSAVEFVRSELDAPEFEWDAGQVSVCYPGYPQPSAAESEAAFRFRVKRHAAHVDGIGRVDAGRRLTESHAFVLGIPLTAMVTGAAALSVWEGSHEVFRQAFGQVLADRNAADWGTVELSDLYRETRARCFETCRRVAITAQPGEAYLVHRLALHGIAPWQDEETAPLRAVIYFRPTRVTAAKSDWWLTSP